MIAAIADTHTAIWYLFSDERLGRAAQVPLDDGIVVKMRQIPRQDIPDLPDRIIAATAKFYSVPVLSRDSRIRSSTIQTIW